MADHELDPRVARTREVVLAAVAELMQSEGLDAVTHSRVAEASGVGRATLYRHWPDVGELLVDAVRARTSSASVLPDVEGVSLPDAAHRLTELLTDAMAQDRMFPVMLGLMERAEHDEIYAVARERITALQSAPLDRILARESEAGRLPDHLDLTHAKALLIGPLFFARIIGEPLQGEADVHAHVAAWLRAIEWTSESVRR